MSLVPHRPAVKAERTGWRDQELSNRHRAWGFDCPCVDLDFLVCEFDRAEPVALVEYKHESAPIQYASHKSYRAIKSLGRRAEVPVFAVRYADDLTMFRVVPLTADAKKHLAEPRQMEEIDFVRFLYRLRGQVPPLDVLQSLREAI